MKRTLLTLALIAFLAGCGGTAEPSDAAAEEIEAMEQEAASEMPADSVDAENYEEALEEMEEEG